MAIGITYGLCESGASEQLGMVTVLVMLTMSVANGLCVINNFMKLRHTPSLWRWLVIGWLLFVITVIELAY